MSDQLLWKVGRVRAIKNRPGYSLVRARIEGSGNRAIALIVEQSRVTHQFVPKCAAFVRVNVRRVSGNCRFIELPGILDPSGFSFPDWPEVNGARLAMVHEKNLFPLTAR